MKKVEGKMKLVDGVMKDEDGGRSKMKSSRSKIIAEYQMQSEVKQERNVGTRF